MLFHAIGVDVDCVNHLGQTLLFCAALMNQEAVAELLLQYGADPNQSVLAILFLQISDLLATFVTFCHQIRHQLHQMCA